MGNIQEITRSYSLSGQIRLLKHQKNSRAYRFFQSSLYLFEFQFLKHYFGKAPGWRLFLRNINSGPRVIPDFAVIGPIKSGTSDLCVHLLQHPCLALPLSKEIFSSDPDDWKIYYPTVSQMQRLAQNQGISRAGMFTPDLHNLEMMYRYSIKVPEAKIILPLRDPVYRAYSHWKWEVFLAGKERASALPYLKSFSQYVARSIEIFPHSSIPSFCDFPLLQTGMYFKSVRLWIEYFGDSNVLVVNMDEYFKDRVKTLSSIYEFLDLPAIEAVNLNSVINRNPLELSDENHDAMASLTSFYRPYNQELYDLIGKDFNWLNFHPD